MVRFSNFFLIKSKAIFTLIAWLVASLTPVYAVVTVTSATGGTNLCMGTFSTLSPITIQEGANNDFTNNQTNVTLILALPAGYEYNPGAGSVSFQGGGDITTATINITTTAATITYSTNGNPTAPDKLTISGLQVKTTGGPSGNITRSASSTSIISGITSSTSFGSLSQGPMMTYNVSNTAQPSTSSVTPGTANVQVVNLNVNVTGSCSPLNLTEITLNTAASTNPSGDITQAKIFYTGSSTTFSTTTPFGNAPSPSGTVVITSSVTLAAGDNNFWIVYDVSTAANIGNILDASITSFKLGGTVYSPSTQNPAGTRSISAPAMGTLDNTFGNSGFTITSIGSGNDIAEDLAVLSDDKIILAGYIHNGTNFDFAMVKYNSNGTIDNTFGSSGKVTTSISSGNDKCHAILVTGSGSIYLIGEASSPTNGLEFAVAKYTPSGSLDISFSSDGIATFSVGPLNDMAFDAALQADNKLVIAGTCVDGGGLYDIGVIRIHPDGTFDDSFGSSGKKIIDNSGFNDEGNSVAINSSGQIYIGGASDDGVSYGFIIAKLTQAGALDNTFELDGIVYYTSATNHYCQDIIIQPNGNVLGTGTHNSGSNGGDAVTQVFQPDGTIQGLKYYTASFNYEEAYDIVMGSDESYYLGGYGDGVPKFHVVKLNSSLDLDTSFDGDGMGFYDLSSGNDFGYAIGLQSNGKIIIGGIATPSNQDFAIARVHNSITASNSITTSALASSTLCKGGTITVSYSITGTFNAGNTFVAQLSDSTGSFASPATIGSVASTTNSPITATIPSNATSASGYRIRVIATDPSTIGSNNGADLTIPYDGGPGLWTWVGGISDNWFDPCNWDKKSLPNSLSDVKIPGGTATQPKITGATANCKTIQIVSGSGGALNIVTTAGGLLNVAQ